MHERIEVSTIQGGVGSHAAGRTEHSAGIRARILHYESALLQKLLRGPLGTCTGDSPDSVWRIGAGQRRRAETPHATWCFRLPPWLSLGDPQVFHFPLQPLPSRLK